VSSATPVDSDSLPLFSDEAWITIDAMPRKYYESATSGHYGQTHWRRGRYADGF
jgi:hypothetical protein